MTRPDENESLARLAAWAVRDRARAVRREVTRPWRRGLRSPEAEAGRWVGLGLALGATLLGAGLAIFVTLSED